MLAQNQEKILAIKQNKFFSTKLNNKVGEAFLKFLVEGNYGNMRNSEPVDVDKNTLSRILLQVRLVENFIGKELTDIKVGSLDRFVSAYRKGLIKRERVLIERKGQTVKLNIKKTNIPRNQHEIVRILSEFKRYLKTFREYMKGKDGFDREEFDSLIEYKPPKVKFTYEKYPYFNISELLSLADCLSKPEYTARMALSLNLMGRKCEVSNLKVSDIDFRKDGSVWAELPHVKKHSSDKVPVELYGYAKERLKKYMQVANLKHDELLFPSKETAFAKDLKKKSIKAFGNSKAISPKHLRKLGVCVAAELELPRHQVEDIGGWVRNSPVLEHYFKRMGVAANHKAESKLSQTEYKDIYVEFDKMKAEHQKALDQLQLFADLLKQKVSVSIDDEKLIRATFEAEKRKKKP